MKKYIPYGTQYIDDNDIKEVRKVLLSDWLTTGPKVEEFEDAISNFCGASYTVVVNSGTAALHSSMYALNIKKGDEVIVPAITFVATANCIVFQGGTPVFADVNEDNLLINTENVRKIISPQTKAIIAVDYAGHPADYEQLRNIADDFNLALVSDSCHAIGGQLSGSNVGTLADISTFSFHPVKHITTGEGGAITTDNLMYAKKIRHFRNHGITNDHRERTKSGSWFYEMTDLGYNYRISDFQCALGISQLKKLNQWIKLRQTIADVYTKAFISNKYITTLYVDKNVSHAYHLYVIRIDFSKLLISRAQLFKKFKDENIGINVHYIPVHWHPYYKKTFGTKNGDCPIAESVYEEIISLPIYPKMLKSDVYRVIRLLEHIIAQNVK